MTGLIDYSIDGGVARLVLNHPERHNAMSLAMWRSLKEYADHAAADPAVRLAVVSGMSTKAFSAGADISEFGKLRNTPEDVAQYDRTIAEATQALAKIPKPTLAAIQGICFGAGLEIALSCDLRVCSEGSRFRVPAARLGLGFHFAGVHQIRERLGRAATAEVLFTAKTYDSSDALRLGIVQQVSPEADFTALCTSYVCTIASNAPLSLAAAKIALIELDKPEQQRDERQAKMAAARCYGSRDYAEGRAAFQEKRQPSFQGD